MNILFIALVDIRKIFEYGIYTDLMREFVKHNHEVYIATPAERRTGIETNLYDDPDYPSAHILKIKTGNIQKTNLIEKGISTVMMEGQVKSAIKKYLRDVHFNLVLYSTPYYDC